jgi:PRTRC genetic system protein C
MTTTTTTATARAAGAASLGAIALKRVFKYGPLSLPDPGAHLTPQAVRQLYAGQHPGLNTASVEGPVVAGDTATYTLVAAVRDKG